MDQQVYYHNIPKLDDDLLMEVLKHVDQPDLTSVVRTCRRLHRFGQMLIERSLQYPVVDPCEACPHEVGRDQKVALARAATLRVLTDPLRAPGVHMVHVQDESNCYCSVEDISNDSLLKEWTRTMKQQYLLILWQVLPNAHNLRCLEISATFEGISSLPPLQTQRPLPRLSLKDHRFFGAVAAGQLRVLQTGFNNSTLECVLPELPLLHTLFLSLDLPDTMSEERPIVRLYDFPNLKLLTLRGRCRGPFCRLFTGSTATVTKLVIDGEFAIHNNAEVFFASLADGLRMLTCRKVKFHTRFFTSFTQLEYIGMHDVLCTSSFPFPNSPALLGLALDMSVGQREPNRVLRSCLNHVFSSLTFLALRSSHFWLLNLEAFMGVYRCHRLTTILLDGAVALGGPYLIILASHQRLQAVVKVRPCSTRPPAVHMHPVSNDPTFVRKHYESTMLRQRIPMMYGDCESLINLSNLDHSDLSVCDCGNRNRIFAFQRLDLHQSYQESYISMISEPRALNCSHRHPVHHDEHGWLAPLSVDDSYQALLRLPAPGYGSLYDEAIYPPRCSSNN